MHKLGYVVVSSTDNLNLSGFVSVVSGGIYSNYYLLIGFIRQILNQVFQGVSTWWSWTLGRVACQLYYKNQTRETGELQLY